MAKRRKRGDGGVSLRKDGRWEWRVVIGYDDKGLPVTKNVLAKTKSECTAKPRTLMDSIKAPSPDQPRPGVLLGDWLDLWYQSYKKPNLLPNTQMSYERRIYQHIIPALGNVQMDKLTTNNIRQSYAGLRACLVSERAQIAQSDFSPDGVKISQAGGQWRNATLPGRSLARSDNDRPLKKFGRYMAENMQACCVRADAKQALKQNGRLLRAELYGQRSLRSNHSGHPHHSLRRLGQSCRRGTHPPQSCRWLPPPIREMQVLTPEEIQRLLIQAKEDSCYKHLLLEPSTGLRRGEICALQWNDLNFRTGELRIERQVHRVKGELVVSPPKTKASNRNVILPAPVLSVPKAYKKTMVSRWIFPSPVNEDSPRDPAAVRKRLQIVLERAGCKKVRFHDLRHPNVKPKAKNFYRLF